VLCGFPASSLSITPARGPDSSGSVLGCLQVGCKKESPLALRSAHQQGARGGQNQLGAGLAKWGSDKRKRVCRKPEVTALICLTSPRWETFVGIVAEECFQEKFKEKGKMGAS